MRPARTTAFPSPQAFRAWLVRHHATRRELFVRCAKVGAGRAGLTYRQALDEALAIGWIDGVRHSLDAARFSVRFSPRKPKSAWSTVNIRRYLELEAEGRVLPPGRAAFATRVKSQYSFESRPRTLAPALQRLFRSKPKAWRHFESQPAWYRRTCSFWVMSAKQPETRKRRLARLIASSEKGESVVPLKRPRAARRAPLPAAAR